MNAKKTSWTRAELKIYILLLCANADFVETPAELRLISTKVDEESFNRIYNEFSMDSEEERLKKIESALAHHDLNPEEVVQLKAEIQEIFLSNKHVSMMEHKLEDLLNKLLK